MISKSEVISKAADLIRDKGFCQGAYAKNKHGHAVSWDSKQATCFCMVGAMRRVLGDNKVNYNIYEEFYQPVTDVVYKDYNFMGIPDFNDQAATRKLALHVMRKAARKAKDNEQKAS